MSLIKCEECGKEISDQSNKCIHCGNKTGNKNNTNNFNQKKVSFYFSIIAVISFGIFSIIELTQLFERTYLTWSSLELPAMALGFLSISISLTLFFYKK